MSYYFDAFKEYYVKNKIKHNDGVGGTITEWLNGAVIKMSLDLGDSTEVRQAQAQGLKTVFTATFPIDTIVEYNDYVEDVETGEIYRITGEPKDNKTPPEARFQACYATAIRTELPQ